MKLEDTIFLKCLYIYNYKNNKNKSISSRYDSRSSDFSNVERLFEIRNIWSLVADKIFLVRDIRGYSYSLYLYFNIEKSSLEIDNIIHNNGSFRESIFSNYPNSNCLNSGSKNTNWHNFASNSRWDKYIRSHIENYLRSEICIDSSVIVLGEIREFLYNIIYNFIFPSESHKKKENLENSMNSIENNHIENNKQPHIFESPDIHLDIDKRMSFCESLWDHCENCDNVNYKQFLKSKMNICEYCGYHLKVGSSDRIEFSVDFATWNPMNEDMVSMDPIEWDSADKDIHPIEWEEWDFSDEDIDPIIEEEGDPADKDIDPIEEKGDSVDKDIHSMKSKMNPKSLKKQKEEFDKASKKKKEGSMDEKEKKDQQNEEKPLKKKCLEEESVRAEPKPKKEDELCEDEFCEDELCKDELFEDELCEDELLEEEEEPYLDRIDSYQRETGLTEAIQTGVGKLNGITIAIGVMDFQFIGGSMGSVVGEKITRLIEYATNFSLPLLIVCASGGARMQEGSLSLMQMVKISSASYNYQLLKTLFYVSILASPTTGGVTASFGMLGDIIIAEPDAYIAFAGKRVIEQTLNTTVPDGSQEAEYLFEKGLFDSIVPRNPLKSVLSELLELHGFCPHSKQEEEFYSVT